MGPSGRENEFCPAFQIAAGIFSGVAARLGHISGGAGREAGNFSGSLGFPPGFLGLFSGLPGSRSGYSRVLFLEVVLCFQSLLGF